MFLCVFVSICSCLYFYVKFRICFLKIEEDSSQITLWGQHYTDMKAKDDTIKRKLFITFLINIDAKNSLQKFSKSNSAIYKREKKIITKWDLVQQYKIGLTFENQNCRSLLSLLAKINCSFCSYQFNIWYILQPGQKKEKKKKEKKRKENHCNSPC